VRLFDPQGRGRESHQKRSEGDFGPGKVGIESFERLHGEHRCSGFCLTRKREDSGGDLRKSGGWVRSGQR